MAREQKPKRKYYDFTNADALARYCGTVTHYRGCVVVVIPFSGEENTAAKVAEQVGASQQRPRPEYMTDAFR